MSIETITYKCGHTATVRMYEKKRADRERKVEWFKTINCPQCKAKAEMARAKAEAEAKHLPELSGSDKQIAWATLIRDKALAVLDKLSATLPADRVAFLQEYTAKWLANETSSRYWIDNRDNLELDIEVMTALDKSTDLMANFKAQMQA